MKNLKEVVTASHKDSAHERNFPPVHEGRDVTIPSGPNRRKRKIDSSEEAPRNPEKKSKPSSTVAAAVNGRADR